jgi:dTDP-4-dehydrorhamnose 3,5-epimerase-like enzyme
MRIIPIDISGQDDRGFTAEYHHDRSGQQLIIFRKAGTISGRHYHKGLSPTKDPEIFILLTGTCTINWKHINDKELQTVQVSGPVKLEFPTYTWHELVMDTDCACLELNSIEEHKADTFYDIPS